MSEVFETSNYVVAFYPPPIPAVYNDSHIVTRGYEFLEDALRECSYWKGAVVDMKNGHFSFDEEGDPMSAITASLVSYLYRLFRETDR